MFFSLPFGGGNLVRFFGGFGLFLGFFVVGLFVCLVLFGLSVLVVCLFACFLFYISLYTLEWPS